MSLSELNLDVNSYTDAQLEKSFGLPDNYTKEHVVASTNRLSGAAHNNFSSEEQQLFKNFLHSAEERLLKKKMVESPGYSDQFDYLDTNNILPSERELTIIPEQVTQIRTQSQGSGVVATVAHVSERRVQQGEQQHKAQPPKIGSYSDEVANTSIPLPVPPQAHAEKWPQAHIKNITSRMILVDSQYRQHITTDTDHVETTDPKHPKPSFNTDFTLDLSEPLKNVVSLKLYSVQIPTSWYAFDDHLGNTVFKFTTNGTERDGYVTPGNYTLDDLIIEINSNKISGNKKIIASPNPNQHVTNVHIDSTITNITFHKPNGIANTTVTPNVNGGFYINQNLGWNLGFRNEVGQNQGGDKGVPVDIYGPKYFILGIDDFNQNNRNKGVETITETFSPISTISVKKTDNTSQQTKAQLYSQGEQEKNNKELREMERYKRAPLPRSTDTFAHIPLKNITTLRDNNEPFVEYGTSLQSNIRTYSSPVDIERLRIRLMDDKGNLVNLHDNDWSFSLVVEQVN